jgi:hypothetical protein
MATVYASKGGGDTGKERFLVRMIVGVRVGLTAWAELVAQRASLKAPVASGELARSIFAGEIGGAGWQIMTIAIGTNLEYAPAQELGSGLHDPELPAKYPIEPIPPTKSLAFEWEGAPAEVEHMRDPRTGLFFFGKVMHPGVPAQPYLRPALMETEIEGRSLLLSALVAELGRSGATSNAVGKKLYP